MRHIVRNITLLPALALMTACAAASAPASGPAPESLRRYVEQANAQFADAFNRGEITELVSLYTPDAVVLAPHAPAAEGIDQIQALWSGAKAQGAQTLVLTTTELSMSGDLATELGTYELKMEPQGRSAATDQGKYIVVWKRQADGSWKIHRDAFNTTLMPQPRAAAGEPVMVVQNTVKRNQKEAFERFVRESLLPAIQQVGQSDPTVAAAGEALRLLTPAKANPDGTFTNLFAMDPMAQGNDYEILPLLTRAYGKAEAAKRHKAYTQTLARSPQVIVSTQAQP